MTYLGGLERWSAKRTLGNGGPPCDGGPPSAGWSPAGRPDPGRLPIARGCRPRPEDARSSRTGRGPWNPGNRGGPAGIGTADRPLRQGPFHPRTGVRGVQTPSPAVDTFEASGSWMRPVHASPQGACSRSAATDTTQPAGPPVDRQSTGRCSCTASSSSSRSRTSATSPRTPGTARRARSAGPARERPQPARPPRADASRGGSPPAIPTREDRLPDDGPAAGPRRARRLPLARPGRGRPAHGPRHGRRGHRGHGLLAGAWRSGGSRRSCSTGSRDYVIVTGMQSVDGDTAQVPPQIAEDLGIDQVAYAQDVHTEPAPHGPAHRRPGHRGRGAHSGSRCSSRSPPAPTRCTAASTPARAARSADDPHLERRRRGRRARPGRDQGLADHRLPDLLPVRGPGQDLRDDLGPGRADPQGRRPSTASPAAARRPTRRAPTRSTAASPPTTASSGSSPSARATASSPSPSSCWARPASWRRSSARRSARSCPARTPATCRPS